MPNKPKFQRSARDRAVDALARPRTAGSPSRQLTTARRPASAGTAPASSSATSTPTPRPRAPSGRPQPATPRSRWTRTSSSPSSATAEGWLPPAAGSSAGPHGTQPVHASAATFVRAMGTDQLAYARKGSQAFRDAQVYLRRPDGYRMQSI